MRYSYSYSPHSISDLEDVGSILGPPFVVACVLMSGSHSYSHGCAAQNLKM